MKAKEIASKYGVNQTDLERFMSLESTKRLIKVSGLFSDTVADNDVPKLVELFNIKKNEEAAKAAEVANAAAIAAAKAAEERRKKESDLANMLITSGFSFDGYTIVKYSGYISGDDATQIPRSGVFGGNNGQNLTDALVKIRIQAIKELKEAAYNLGCNAVIGVDFDYITLEPETANIGGGTLYEPYIICVTANGNAVVIEKNN